MLLSPPAEKIRLAVTSRCKKTAPEFQIVPDRAHKLFEKTAEKFRDTLDELPNFWERAAFLKARVLKFTKKKLRGDMARLYHEYTTAMFRGELATMEDEPVFKEIDPNIEEIARYHAYLACTAGD
ncbi:hypothetical protein EBZ39_01155 [bacterium]|nr:hypothetical protein [bacterium]